MRCTPLSDASTTWHTAWCHDIGRGVLQHSMGCGFVTRVHPHSAGRAIPEGFLDLYWTKVDLQVRGEVEETCYHPFVLCSLRGPKSSVICASTICSTFSEFVFYFFLGVCLCDVHKDFCGDKVHCGVPTIAVSLRLSESVFLLISSLPGPLQIATCLAIPQVYQTFPEVSHTQQWHNLSCFLRCS